MKPEEIDKLLDDVLLYCGAQSQAGMAMEECGELITVLHQFFFRDRITKRQVASEIADVEIMCQQLAHIIGRDLIEDEKQKKLLRLKERLKGWKQ